MKAPPHRRRVWLHVGAPKTGTTYLQEAFAANRSALRKVGLLYPGTATDHFLPSLDLRRTRFMGHHNRTTTGSWQRMVSECRRWPDDSFISHETLGVANGAAIARAVADFDWADVHVLLTARDLARQLPAVWQESVKNRSTATFHEFTSALRSGVVSGGPAAAWRGQRLAEVLARWERSVPTARIHVLTVPPVATDGAALLDRVCLLLGIPRLVLQDPGAGRNVSLGAAEACALRLLNERLPSNISWPTYEAVVKVGLAEGVLARRDVSPIQLSDEEHAWARGESQRLARRLQRAGYDIVGDLSEIVPQPRDRPLPYVDPDAPPPSDVLDACLDAWSSLVADTEWTSRRRIIDGLRRGFQQAARGRPRPGRSCHRRIGSLPVRAVDRRT